VNELLFGNNTKHSWSPRAKFVVSLMSNCTHFKNKLISRAMLKHLCNLEVSNAAVFFLKSNKQALTICKQNTNYSTQGTYLELHTWYPYENLDSPTERNVLVKVFTVRNLSHFRRSEIFRRYIDKNFHGSPINVYVRELLLAVYSTGHVWVWGLEPSVFLCLWMGSWIGKSNWKST